MFTNERPVWAEVDLNAVKFNMENIKKLAKGKRIISVVKANAYGHGMKEVATTMKKIGIKDFAVAILNEAMEFRTFDKDSSIMILGFTPGEGAKEVVANDITVTVFTYDEAKKFSDEAVKEGKKVKISIALDTGMSRIGFNTSNHFDESVKEIKRIKELPNIVLEEVFSHFSTADDRDKGYSKMQLDRYIKMTEKLREEGVVFNHYHHANSAAIMDLPESHFDTVRPGIIQYGYYPSDEVMKDRLELRPIIEWKAKIVMIKEIEDGVPVSYGNTYKAKGKRKIATIPLGYADGYSRAQSNKGIILVNGKEAPIAGRICMDQFMVDVTDIPYAKVGDIVTLLGKSGDLEYTAHDMAKLIGTISYEITCNIGMRVPRKYIELK